MANEVMTGVPVQVTTLSPTGFALQGSHVEVTVLGLAQTYGQTSDGTYKAAAHPVGQLNLSYPVAKQLAVSLMAIVDQYEADFGAIDERIVPSPEVVRA